MLKSNYLILKVVVVQQYKFVQHINNVNWWLIGTSVWSYSVFSHWHLGLACFWPQTGHLQLKLVSPHLVAFQDFQQCLLCHFWITKTLAEAGLLVRYTASSSKLQHFQSWCGNGSWTGVWVCVHHIIWAKTATFYQIITQWSWKTCQLKVYKDIRITTWFFLQWNDALFEHVGGDVESPDLDFPSPMPMKP